MANHGYFCISGKRIVLEEACDILIGTPDGEDRLWGDRWDHLDGKTLQIYRDGQVLHTYMRGEWTRCYRDPDRADIRELWPEEEYQPNEAITL